ncbi:flagellar biosynthesis anti-sigma factor FlgM [Proteinivorax hydrogeniformans]|uniref:Negative regulator of flagellin synthesis n=1 Tax=Proteinivorax hydrogeniformans TaxID=1826727 RepID=A0AAU8HUT1_9FIRM
MKITGLKGVQAAYQKNSTSQTDTQLKNEKIKKAASLDVSQRAKDLAVARKALDKLDGVRDDKVNLIKEQIETGTYKVDTKVLAKKMLTTSWGK